MRVAGLLFPKCGRAKHLRDSVPMEIVSCEFSDRLGDRGAASSGLAVVKEAVSLLFTGTKP